MAKQFITEAARMQKLAGIIPKEPINEAYQWTSTVTTLPKEKGVPTVNDLPKEKPYNKQQDISFRDYFKKDKTKYKQYRQTSDAMRSLADALISAKNRSLRGSEDPNSRRPKMTQYVIKRSRDFYKDPNQKFAEGDIVKKIGDNKETVEIRYVVPSLADIHQQKNPSPEYPIIPITKDYEKEDINKPWILTTSFSDRGGIWEPERKFELVDSSQNFYEKRPYLVTAYFNPDIENPGAEIVAIYKNGEKIK